MLPDGTLVCAAYGKFGERNADGSLKTYVVSKRIKMGDVDKLYDYLKNA